LIKLLESDSKINGPINLGNPNEISILDLANKIIDLTKSTSKIKHLQIPADDPKQRKPDISKAIAELNWKPHISLDAGLKSTIKYFENILAQ